MTKFNAEDFVLLEERLTALEGTKEEREINALVIRIVRSVKLTLWLTNGAVKWLGAPIGILWGLYAYGVNVLEALGHLLAGLGKG